MTIQIPEAKCLRCESTWPLRITQPKRCPRCGSPYWNKERVRNINDKRKARSRVKAPRRKS